jgi:8-oxo-dGTP diphosphatase
MAAKCGNAVTSFRWIPEPPPLGIVVRQVYGFCFDDSGRVLLTAEAGRYGLPGGRPETGEDHHATLARECLEESQILIGEPLYIGYQEATDDGQEPYTCVCRNEVMCW